MSIKEKSVSLMDIMLKFGFPAIMLVIGMSYLLIGKKNDNKRYILM